MHKSPILLLAYNRSDLLERTITALVECENSSEYDLFVHIDAPNVFKINDIEKNHNVKEIVDRHGRWFKSCTVMEEHYHMGLSNSVIKCVQDIISKYGRIIVIEDDLLISRDGLTFLDDALDYYENDNRVWAVTGYSAPLKCLKDYEKSVYWTYRGESWFWGTWKDRWECVDWDVGDYGEFLKDFNLRMKLCRGGYDLPGMLKDQIEGLVDSWAVRWIYTQNKLGMMCVHPTNNRVYNIGFEDGTHVNAESFSELMQMRLLEDYPEYRFEENIDQQLIEEYMLFNGDNSDGWDEEFRSFSRTDRFESMFHVMHLWRSLNETGHSISEYFINRDYKTISIYGRGIISHHMEKELDGSGVQIAYFIDKNPQLWDGKKCIGPDEVLPECDCLVLSVTDIENDIRPMLRRRFSGPIKTFVDVLKDR